MSASDQPADIAAVDQLIEANDFDGARALLDATSDSSDAVLVIRIKLALYDGSLPPGAAMQKLIAIMRRNADAPGAKELYKEASNVAYQSRQSSVSHSHAPPPVATDGDEHD
jgi:hypothetical protein